MTSNKNSYQKSQEDILAGRIEKFSSSDEMFKSLGLREIPKTENGKQKG